MQNDHSPATETLTETAPPGDLDRRSDDELRALIRQATAILDAREKERRAEALEQIRQLARKHGLSVEVSDSKCRFVNLR